MTESFLNHYRTQRYFTIIAQDHAFCRRPGHITLEVQVGKVRTALGPRLKVGTELDVRAEINVSVDFRNAAGARATGEPQKGFNAGATRELGSAGAGAGVSRALLRRQPLAPLRV
jgi:hypothetical protein